MSNEERLTILEELSALLVQFARRVDERVDELAEAQANSERKIAALADAQIRTEEVVANLTAKMSEMASAQVHTDQRLDALIDIVRERQNGKS